MADDDKKAPIIIKKKKISGHGGHHGGAWKVAFADFMTAMMAFFLVMWLMGSDDETKAAVAAYFNNPSIARDGKSNLGAFSGGDASGKNDGASGRFEEKNLKQPTYAPPVNIEEYSILKDLESFYEGSAFTADVEGDTVKYTITPRVKFELGDVNVPTDEGTRTFLAKMIHIFRQHDGIIVLEGFADEKQDWPLAFGRAMSVKRILMANGILEEKLIPTAGYDVGDNSKVKAVDIRNTGTVRFILKRKRK